MTSGGRTVFGFLLAAGALGLVLAQPAAGRAGQDDPFAAQFQAGADRPDPFAGEFEAKGLPAAPAAKSGAPKESGQTATLATLITFQVQVDPPVVKRGKVVTLTLVGKLKPGYHTYPITQRTAEQTQLTELRYELPPGLKPLWPVRESKPVFHAMQLGKSVTVTLEHEKEVTWSQDVLVLPEAEPGSKAIGIHLNIMACNKNGCIGPAPYRRLEAAVTVSSGSVALSPVLRERLREREPAPAIVPVPPGGLREVQAKTTDETTGPDGGPAPAATTQAGLWGLLGSAFVGAFLMLLTPCVFPMIPITVNFFLKQSEKEHHNALPTACVYSGTIILLLTFVMLVLGQVVVQWANNAWFNLALGAVLIYFALSLFGMYEIELPSGLARFTSAHEGQGGYLGAMFMALTFTITSFTCTGPFLGALLAPVAGLRPPFFHLFLASLVYSTTFAAPFFVLALFPRLLRRLPKSGGWLNSIKVTMGFLELGAALKFLANTDFAWNPGNPRLFNYETVLCAWVALSVLTGLYLLGVFRLPHDDRVEHVGVLSMLFASIFFGLALYMTPALWGERLHGVIGENIQAFLPLKLQSDRAGASGKGNPERLSWHLDYTDAWKEATQNNKLLLIDFTGVFCTNCRQNEENVFPIPRVSPLLARYARVQLYTDTVPNSNLSAGAAKSEAERNSQWREKMLHDVTLPLYVIFQPDRDQPLTNDGRPKGRVLAWRKGTIFDVDDFVRFLNTEPAQLTVTARAD